MTRESIVADNTNEIGNGIGTCIFRWYFVDNRWLVMSCLLDTIHWFFLQLETTKTSNFEIEQMLHTDGRSSLAF